MVSVPEASARKPAEQPDEPTRKANDLPISYGGATSESFSPPYELHMWPQCLKYDRVPVVDQVVDQVDDQVDGPQVRIVIPLHLCVKLPFCIHHHKTYDDICRRVALHTFARTTRRHWRFASRFLRRSFQSFRNWKIRIRSECRDGTFAVFVSNSRRI